MGTSDRATTRKSHVNQALRNLTSRLSPHMRYTAVGSFLLALIFAASTLYFMDGVLRTRSLIEQYGEAYRACQEAADELMMTSDFLTEQARKFVTSGQEAYLDNYIDEIEVHDQRGKALETLREHAADPEAVKSLAEARAYSDELARTELYALALVAHAKGITDHDASFAEVTLSAEDEEATTDQKMTRAAQMVNGSSYNSLKLRIREQVMACSSILVTTLRADFDYSNSRMDAMVSMMRICVIALLLVVFFLGGSMWVFLLWPILLHERSIRDNEPLASAGSSELRTLVSAYNEMYERTTDREQSLSYEAGHDALTGLLNRGSFDSLLTHHKCNCALLLIDVDNFKHFNDDYGHEMGDAVLVEVAAVLHASFRACDHVCRIGGDEFAVIATDMGPTLKEVLANKINKVAAFLCDTSNGLPSVTVSVGIAFGWYGCADDDLFQAADGALYLVKERGRDGFAFAEQD